MAGKRILTQIEMLINSTLGSPESGYIGIGAKSDGLYMKTPSVEYMLLSEANRRSDVRATGSTGSDIVTETGIRAAIEAGYTHTHPYQPLDADLTAIAALSGTSGMLKKTAANTWTLDTGTYLTGTKVDSFNSRTGVVTLTKADVEGVLTGLITSHTHNYDNYQNWNLKTAGVQRLAVGSGMSVDFVGSGATSVGYSNGVVTISSTNTDTNNYPTGLSFSTSTGILTLSRNGMTALTESLDGRYLATKADVEGVLTGDITSHTHPSYDYYNHWKLYVNSVLMDPITSAYQLNFLSGTGISVTADDANNSLTFANLSPFPGFGTTAGLAAEGNHTHTGYASSTHTHTLAVLTDTTITSPASGEILKWNGSKWINNTLAEAGIQAVGAMSLASLSDTTITSPATGEVLKWSGTKWINNTLAEAGIAAASHTHSYDNYGSWQAQAGGNTLNITSNSWLNFVGGTGISLAFDTVNHKITITNTALDVTYSAYRTTDISLTNANTWYTFLSTTLAAGMYLVISQVSVTNTSQASAIITSKIHDGTTTNYSSGTVTIGTTPAVSGTITLHSYMNLAASTTVRFSVASSKTGTIVDATLPTNNGGATTTKITCIKIA